MKTKEARALGKRLAALVHDGRMVEAYDLLAPVLAERTPFAMLRRIGEPIAACSQQGIDAFLDLIALDRTEGGWVVIQSVLGQMVDRDLDGAFVRCRDFIAAADVWYAADIMGEGVVGQALVRHFDPALALLAPWRADEDRWVRRAVGVSVHFWAKRSRGVEQLRPRAEALLAFLEPMFEEWDMKAAKGVGWGLKTLGKHYPDLLAVWLSHQLPRRHRAVIERKALTWLSEEQRAQAQGAFAANN